MVEAVHIDDPRPLEGLTHSYLTVRHPRMKTVLKIQAGICAAIREFLESRGFTELLPPIIGPVSDPGIRGAKQVSVDFYGRDYRVMSSAILYKQMLAASLGKIYFFSPNVRLEPPETVHTRRHLVEFVQVDLEEAGASYHEAIQLAEALLVKVCTKIRDRFTDELLALGRELKMPTPPFPRFTHYEAVKLLQSKGFAVSHGQEIPWTEEEALSTLFSEPYFIIDFPKGARGFYDQEDPVRRDPEGRILLKDFDLHYPEGYGEAASGAEREYEYEKVLARIRATGENPAKYGWYLDMLRSGISPSSGFGIGVERLTRFICGLKAVWEARPYPKVAGIYSP